MVDGSADPGVSKCPASPLPTVASDDSGGGPSGGRRPRGTTLVDTYHDTQVSADASMIRSPRIDANRLTLRQSCAASPPAPDPARAAIPTGLGGDPGAIFDPEYAAFRATLLALAREGHRLLGRIAEGHPEADSRAVRDFLRRLDLFEERAARSGWATPRRWLRNLRGLFPFPAIAVPFGGRCAPREGTPVPASPAAIPRTMAWSGVGSPSVWSEGEV
jgi:hypothetical protein